MLLLLTMLLIVTLTNAFDKVNDYNKIASNKPTRCYYYRMHRRN